MQESRWAKLQAVLPQGSPHASFRLLPAGVPEDAVAGLDVVWHKVRARACELPCPSGPYRVPERAARAQATDFMQVQVQCQAQHCTPVWPAHIARLEAAAAEQRKAFLDSLERVAQAGGPCRAGLCLAVAGRLTSPLPTGRRQVAHAHPLHTGSSCSPGPGPEPAGTGGLPGAPGGTLGGMLWPAQR